jgi:hypothetical protein
MSPAFNLRPGKLLMVVFTLLFAAVLSPLIGATPPNQRLGSIEASCIGQTADGGRAVQIDGNGRVRAGSPGGQMRVIGTITPAAVAGFSARLDAAGFDQLKTIEGTAVSDGESCVIRRTRGEQHSVSFMTGAPIPWWGGGRYRAVRAVLDDILKLHR